MPTDIEIVDWLEARSNERTIDISRHRARWGVAIQGDDGHGIVFGRGNDLREAVGNAMKQYSNLLEERGDAD